MIYLNFHVPDNFKDIASLRLPRDRRRADRARSAPAIPRTARGPLDRQNDATPFPVYLSKGP